MVLVAAGQTIISVGKSHSSGTFLGFFVCAEARFLLSEFGPVACLSAAFFISSILLAKRLSIGKVYGIDLWRSEDESGNHSDATLTNAQIERVADHVEVKTGDVREIPFPDSMFDVVVSSLAIHNISENDERTKVIREIARVLKPQGRIALLDVRDTQEYAKTQRDIGWQEVELSGLWFLMFPLVRVVRDKNPYQTARTSTRFHLALFVPCFY